ncbi:teneurin-a [Trichonephila clavipes]|nr:teneurin-a [Trichonephila clavipes]
MTLKGYDMDTSELGGWNLDIHHRYNFHEGVLQKGDGTTIYFKQQPRVITTLMGTGHQRPLLCPECNGMAKEARLLAPVALTSGPDGSVYVGDFNLIRRITPNGQVYTVFRMRTTDMSTHYHITLSPTDGHLYISDPERHQILRINSLDKVEDPESNFDVVVGSGDRCLPRDRDNCGDGKPALEARLSYPKDKVIRSQSNLRSVQFMRYQETHCKLGKQLDGQQDDSKGFGSTVVKVSDHGRHVMSSAQYHLRPAVKGSDALYICRELKCPFVGVVVRRGVPAQVPSPSVDYDSKLRGPSSKALLQLNSATLIFTHSLTQTIPNCYSVTIIETIE